MAAVIFGAAMLSYVAPLWGTVLVLVGLGGVVLFQQPRLGLLVILLCTACIRFGVGTGSEVTLNAVTAVVPVILVVWALDMIRRGQLWIIPSGQRILHWHSSSLLGCSPYSLAP